MSSSGKIKVLFVCMGNICRSPLAEGVFNQLLAKDKLSDRFMVDSAGTSNYHVGDAPDKRAIVAADCAIEETQSGFAGRCERFRALFQQGSAHD